MVVERLRRPHRVQRIRDCLSGRSLDWAPRRYSKMMTNSLKNGDIMAQKGAFNARAEPHSGQARAAAGTQPAISSDEQENEKCDTFSRNCRISSQRLLNTGSNHQRRGEQRITIRIRTGIRSVAPATRSKDRPRRRGGRGGVWILSPAGDP